MKIEGKVWKDGKFWIVSIPGLDLSTQGMTRKEAFKMARSVVEDVVDKVDFKVAIDVQENGHFMISSDNVAELVALLLKRQRAKQGLSLMEVARRMGSKSPNAFGAYEQGKREPSISTLEKLVRILNPKSSLMLGLA